MHASHATRACSRKSLFIMSTNNHDFIDLGEVQEITGFSRAKIYQLTSRKKIPHFRLGGKLRFSRSDLISWVEAHRVPVLEGGEND